MALKNGQPVIVTQAENGIIAAAPDGGVVYSESLPVRGDIDIVGAGDAVMANVATALAAKGDLAEAIDLANIAASVVLHKLGTTGTATVKELQDS